MAHRPFGQSLPSVERARIEALIAANGESATVLKLGIPRQTLARALGGLGLRVGTIVLLRQQLAKLDRRNRQRTNAEMAGGSR